MIYVSLSAFGSEGPERARRGFDAAMQAESGLMSITGEEGGLPMKAGAPVIDMAAGLALSQAVLAALLLRNKTGIGEYIKLSLLDVAIYLQSSAYTKFFLTGEQPGRWGHSTPFGYPTDLFPAKDGYIQVIAYLPNHWKTLCKALAMEHLLVDPRFETNENRLKNKHELHHILAEVFLTKSKNEWVEMLLDQGIAVGNVKTFSEVAENEQVKQNKVFMEVMDKKGPVKTVRPPYRFDSWSTQVRIQPPTLGEHTAQIMDELGYKKNEIEQLMEDGIIK